MTTFNMISTHIKCTKEKRDGRIEKVGKTDKRGQSNPNKDQSKGWSEEKTQRGGPTRRSCKEIQRGQTGRSLRTKGPKGHKEV